MIDIILGAIMTGIFVIALIIILALIIVGLAGICAWIEDWIKKRKR